MLWTSFGGGDGAGEIRLRNSVQWPISMNELWTGGEMGNVCKR